ncbi:hypothetical protein ACOSQ2_001966 [Xanthoceras sorbifolium]
MDHSLGALALIPPISFVPPLPASAPDTASVVSPEKESSVVAGVDVCDSEEEPLLRRLSAKGKGPAIQKEEGPPRSMGGDGAEVRMDVADGYRGVILTSSDLSLEAVLRRVLTKDIRSEIQETADSFLRESVKKQLQSFFSFLTAVTRRSFPRLFFILHKC